MPQRIAHTAAEVRRHAPDRLRFDVTREVVATLMEGAVITLADGRRITVGVVTWGPRHRTGHGYFALADAGLQVQETLYEGPVIGTVPGEVS